MTFIIVTLVSAVLIALVLSVNRFSDTEAARKTTIYADIAREYRRWLVRRTPAALRSSRRRLDAGTARWVPAFRKRDFFVWLQAAFVASFLYLAVSGFFFAVFVPRGLHGYPLLGHVTAGGVFAVSLTTLAFLRGREYMSAAPAAGPAAAAVSFDPRRWAITAAGARNAAFWVFVLAGILLMISAVAPMLPFVRTAGQRLFLEIHRYAALLSVLSAAVFVERDLYGRKTRTNA